MKGLLLSLLICISWSLSGQFVIRGRVYDAIMKDPIEEVRVFSSNASEVVSTDSLGFFKIALKSLPAEISFQHVGYYPEKFKVSDPEPMEVYLESSSWLNSIQIGTSKSDEVAGTKERWIWDYALMDRFIVVCDYGTSLQDARLVCLNENGDTIAIGNCPTKPLEMFTDCEGNVQVQGKDSTYQVVVTSEGITCLKGEHNLMINKFLRRCVDQDDVNYYFAVPDGGIHEYKRGRRVVEEKNDEMWYFRGSKELNERFGFWVVQDAWVKKMKDEEDSFGRNPATGQYASSRAGDEGRFDRIFFNQIFIKEIYAPLFSFQDTVYVFDHANGRIEKFSKWGIHQYSTPISYHASRDFKRQILRDHLSGFFYAVFEKNATTYLCKLDPHSGAISNKYAIPYPFPKKIEVLNGYVYFLHREDDSNDAQLLSKMKMN